MDKDRSTPKEEDRLCTIGQSHGHDAPDVLRSGIEGLVAYSAHLCGKSRQVENIACTHGMIAPMLSR